MHIYICVKPLSLTKNEGKLFLVPKSSGPLLAGLPLNQVVWDRVSAEVRTGDVKMQRVQNALVNGTTN